MTYTQMQALLDKQVKGKIIYNVVAGVQSKDGRVDWAGAAGIADAVSKTTMTPDTPYCIASVTKMYTTAVVLNLVKQGRLDLEASISQYLPTTLIDGIHVYKGKDYSSQIKVYQLVNQTSGLADYETDKPKGGRSVLDDLKQGRDVALTVPEIMNIVRKIPPAFEPGADNGTKAHYASTNYQLLGEIIEAITEKSVAEVFEQMIFVPLGLGHTYLYTLDTPQSPERPATFYLKDKPSFVPKYLASNRTDGGIVSTVRENLIFLHAFFEGKFFDTKHFDRMLRWNKIFFPMQYGYGMMRLNLPRIFSPFRPFPEYIGHSGSTGSFAYYCPDKELYLAGTINQIAAPSRPIRLMMQLASIAK